MVRRGGQPAYARDVVLRPPRRRPVEEGLSASSSPTLRSRLPSPFLARIFVLPSSSTLNLAPSPRRRRSLFAQPSPTPFSLYLSLVRTASSSPDSHSLKKCNPRSVRARWLVCERAKLDQASESRKLSGCSRARSAHEPRSTALASLMSLALSRQCCCALTLALMLCWPARRHRPTHKPIVVAAPPSCVRLSLGPLPRARSVTKCKPERNSSMALFCSARAPPRPRLCTARPTRLSSPRLDLARRSLCRLVLLGDELGEDVDDDLVVFLLLEATASGRVREPGQLVRAERERERERRTHETTTTPTRDSTPLTRSGKPPPWHAYCGRGDSCQLEVWCERGRASEERRDAHRRCWRRSGPGSRSCPSP